MASLRSLVRSEFPFPPFPPSLSPLPIADVVNGQDLPSEKASSLQDAHDCKELSHLPTRLRHVLALTDTADMAHLVRDVWAHHCAFSWLNGWW